MGGRVAVPTGFFFFQGDKTAPNYNQIKPPELNTAEAKGYTKKNEAKTEDRIMSLKTSNVVNIYVFARGGLR